MPGLCTDCSTFSPHPSAGHAATYVCLQAVLGYYVSELACIVTSHAQTAGYSAMCGYSGMHNPCRAALGMYDVDLLAHHLSS